MSFTLNNLGFLIRNFNLFKTKKLATNIPVFCKVYFHKIMLFWDPICNCKNEYIQQLFFLKK